eukprot:PITA_26510
MDGFSGYNQINIRPQDQSKTAFICPWGTFAYHKLPFGLSNAGANFQRAMNYAFHDIKNIVQPYLDDLPAHLRKRTDHLQHLRAIFLHCRHYKIRLNPHKCVFYVTSGRLLGFVVSNDGIRLDPCKVQPIIDLPPPSNFASDSETPRESKLSEELLGGKYSKWIVILQEFDLEFKKSKSKKALVFAKLLCDLPSSSNDATSKYEIMDESLFLISSRNLWYGDIIIYLQTQTYRSNTSRSEQRRIRYQEKDYMIIGDMLYHHGIDTVLRRCLTHEEAKKVLNDCHSGACGVHQSGYATAQKILRAGYFWPTMFKDCITTVRSCHACQIFNRKTRIPPAPLQPVVAIGPFSKWGIDFMTCNPTSAGGHGYIIVTVDYFTKWVEAMLTLNNNGETTALFFFNHVVSRFGVPRAIVTDHGSHFRNHMMVELAAKLGLSHDSSTPYYPQANG